VCLEAPGELELAFDCLTTVGVVCPLFTRPVLVGGKNLGVARAEVESSLLSERPAEPAKS